MKLVSEALGAVIRAARCQGELKVEVAEALTADGSLVGGAEPSCPLGELTRGSSKKLLLLAARRALFGSLLTPREQHVLPAIFLA